MDKLKSYIMELNKINDSNTSSDIANVDSRLGKKKKCNKDKKNISEGTDNIVYYNKDSKELWLSYAQGSGRTTQLPDIEKYLTNKSTDKNYDSSVDRLVKWSTQNKPMKAKGNSKLFEIPVYGNYSMGKRYDIFDGDIKAQGKLYMIIDTNPTISVINFFKRKVEAQAWMNSLSESLDEGFIDKIKEKIKELMKNLDDMDDNQLKQLNKLIMSMNESEEYKYETDNDFEDYDIDGNGKITVKDLVYLTQDLSQNALIEIIDIVTDYLEDEYEKSDDEIPGDSYYEIKESDKTNESVIRKRVVRNGKKMIIKKSSKPGFKLVGGKEVKMTPKEIRNRIKSAKIASKKRKSKKSQSNRKRLISLSKK